MVGGKAGDAALGDAQLGDGEAQDQAARMQPRQGFALLLHVSDAGGQHPGNHAEQSAQERLAGRGDDGGGHRWVPVCW